jgi:predicted nucleic acid-binding protein
MFLDTSGLLCFHHRAEPLHHEAVQFFKDAPVRLTHNYILAEFVALAKSRGLPRAPALDFVSELQDNPLIDIVYVDQDLHRQSLELLRRRGDKTWSLADSVSFLLMQMRQIQTALTTDHDFEQAGFVRLLKP